LKKIYFKFLLFSIVLTALVSCSEEETVVGNKEVNITTEETVEVIKNDIIYDSYEILGRSIDAEFDGEHIWVAHYEDSKSITRRINDMKNWLKKPSLIQPDKNAQYEEIIEIDLAKVTQPIVACPNDPDNVKEITDVANTNIDEVFIGSCMTNIGHYRAAAKVLEGVENLKAKLWICPPTKMDEDTLKAEGYYKIFENCGARLELPGCSLCMGNQARVDEGSVVFSTSTRNFDNRLGKNAQVFLGSAELAAVCALLGKIPEVEEYQDITKNKINPYSDELYRYLQFDEIRDFSLSK